MFGTGNSFEPNGRRRGVRRRFEEISESDASERRGQSSFERNLFGQLTNKRQKTLAETLASLHLSSSFVRSNANTSAADQQQQQQQWEQQEQQQQQLLREVALLYGARPSTVPGARAENSMDIDSGSDRFVMLSESVSSPSAASSSVYSQMPSLDNHPFDRPTHLSSSWRFAAHESEENQPDVRNVPSHNIGDEDLDEDPNADPDALPPTIVPRVKSVYGEVPSLRDFFFSDQVKKQSNSMDRLYRHYQYQHHVASDAVNVDPNVCREVVVFNPVTRLPSSLVDAMASSCARQRAMHLRHLATKSKGSHHHHFSANSNDQDQHHLFSASVNGFETSNGDMMMDVDATRAPSSSGNLSHSEWFIEEEEEEEEEEEDQTAGQQAQELGRASYP